MVLWLDLSNECQQEDNPFHRRHRHKPQSGLSPQSWKQEHIPLVREREREREQHHEQGHMLHDRTTTSGTEVNGTSDRSTSGHDYYDYRDERLVENGDGDAGNGDGTGGESSEHELSTASMTVRNPNMNSFSTALGCYPIVREIAGQLDLNTLHDLSRTCRQIRANLIQYRRQLVRCSLRCVNDVSVDAGRLDGGEALPGQRVVEQQSTDEPFYMVLRLPPQRQGWQQARLDGRTREYALQGGVSVCARDMVKECRRCGKVVCRNCTIKPPGKDSFDNRHRRLCQVCQNVPLEMQTEPLYLIASSSKAKSVTDKIPDTRSLAEAAALNPIVSVSDTFSQNLISQRTPDDRSIQFDHGHDHNLRQHKHQHHQNSNRSFTYDAFRHHPCCCADSVWLCNDCGRTLNSATLMYKRGWLWRKRYSDYLGGQLSGIGEGSEGVHCGREMYCLDAKKVEHVIEWNDRSESSGDGDRGQAGNTLINGNGIYDHTSTMSGPAVAGGDAGGSNVTTSDYIEVGGSGSSGSSSGGGGSSSNSSSTCNITNTIDHNHSNHHHHMINPHINIDTREAINASASVSGRPRPRPRPRHEPSYYAREVEGIGGVVRRTTSHRERIGAIVPEYEGERATGQYLKAEREGAVRSWCSWCFRVVPGRHEEEEEEEEEEEGKSHQDRGRDGV